MGVQVVSHVRVHAHHFVKVAARNPVMVAHPVVDVLHVLVIVRDVQHLVVEPVQTLVLLHVGQAV